MRERQKQEQIAALEDQCGMLREQIDGWHKSRNLDNSQRGYLRRAEARLEQTEAQLEKLRNTVTDD